MAIDAFIYKSFRGVQAVFSFVKIFSLKSLLPRQIKMSLPVLGKSFSLHVTDGGVVHLENLRARDNVTLLCDGGVLSLGRDVFMNNQCSINCLGNISIGDGTLLGENVRLYDHDHLHSSIEGVVPDRYSVGEINVGRRCWIGSNTIILKDVYICDNVIIGAGSIVKKSIGEPGVYVMKNGSMLKVR